LVLDGPVFLDLIGTCHSGHQKPAILKPEHLVLHTLQQDCRQNSPHAPAALRGGHKIESDQKGLHSPQFMSATAVEDFYRACLGHTDPLCLKSSLPLLRVSVAPTELLFNHKHTSSSSPSSAFTQSVSITNHTRRKLSLVWTAAQESPFSIAPSSCDLAPLKSTLFRVTYAPKQLNTLHGAQLECFAYNKCGGKAVCVSGRRQHFIFPANSSGLAGPAHPSHQEPKPVASEVGCLICFCALILVVFSDIFQCIVCSLDLPQDHSSCLQLAFSDFLS
uniref:Fibronectin type-III domain-containing protein n=1 Tax=Astatotilapia calliptera TaxID=8154 RepID=A0AAX7TJC7_ASTCA